jgi:ABC-type Mn2+/Zn2+ transport system ATPase subunit
MLSIVKVHNRGAQIKLYEMMRESSRINVYVLIVEHDLHLFLRLHSLALLTNENLTYKI